MNLAIMWFYIFTGILIYIAVSLYLRLYGKGKKDRSKLSSEELVILPFCFRACIFLAVGMILLLIQIHALLPMESTTMAYVLLGIASALLLIGIIFLARYFGRKEELPKKPKESKQPKESKKK